MRTDWLRWSLRATLKHLSSISSSSRNAGQLWMRRGPEIIIDQRFTNLTRLLAAEPIGGLARMRPNSYLASVVPVEDLERNSFSAIDLREHVVAKVWNVHAAPS